MTRYVDMTPTWPEAARIIAAALENGTGDGREAARAELFRMADIITHLSADQNPTHDATDDAAHQLDRLRRALDIAGEACDLGAIRRDDETRAHDALNVFWSVYSRAKPSDAEASQ